MFCVLFLVHYFGFFVFKVVMFLKLILDSDFEASEYILLSQ